MIHYGDIKKLHVELSSACNAACPVCPRNEHGGPTREGLLVDTFTLIDFETIFKPDLVSNLTQIIFCGRYGDPIYCKDLPQIVAYVREHNPTVGIRIHTNGGIRSVEWWAELGQFKYVDVIFSLDGLADTNHIYRRRVKWDKVIANAQAYIDAGGKANWEYLIFEHNQHQVDEAQALAEQMGFASFQLKRPYGFNSVNHSNQYLDVYNANREFEYRIRPSSDKEFRNEAFATAQSNEPEPEPKLKLTTKEEVTPLKPKGQHVISCHAIKQQEIYVDAQGHVYPCCWLGFGGQDADYGSDGGTFNSWLLNNVKLQNINAHNLSIQEILESDYFAKIQETWNDENTQFLTCVEMCGKNQNLRQRLNIEKVN